MAHNKFTSKEIVEAAGLLQNADEFTPNSALSPNIQQFIEASVKTFGAQFTFVRGIEIGLQIAATRAAQDLSKLN